jgi:hypothetical protein
MNTIKRTALPLALASAATLFGGCIGTDPGDDGDSSTAGSSPTDEAVSALASDCENGANGFIDISDSLSGHVERSSPLDSNARGGLEVTLQSGIVAGTRRGWAKITGPTTPGDQVWMDWTRNSGSTWLRCGPFTVGNPNMTKTSAAKRTSSLTSYQFRACGWAIGGSPHCTTWW